MPRLEPVGAQAAPLNGQSTLSLFLSGLKLADEPPEKLRAAPRL